MVRFVQFARPFHHIILKFLNSFYENGPAGQKFGGPLFPADIFTTFYYFNNKKHIS